MKRYYSNKIIQAGRISSIGRMSPSRNDPLGQAIEITLEDGSQFHEMGERFGNARPGHYFVIYEDGYKSVNPNLSGYTELAGEGLPFGAALEAVKQGMAIARTGWNGKGMFVYLVAANAYPATSRIAKAHFFNEPVPYNAYFAIKGVDGRVSTWTPSIGDCLASDWNILDLADVSPILGSSQVSPAMARPSIPTDRAAEAMDHDQLAKLGELLAKAEPNDAMKAPSVSEERINMLVASLTCETARIPGTTSTVATARLPGGFVVAVGHSACVSPDNFNAELGQKYAIENATLAAREKLWEFEGYRLALELGRAPAPASTPAATQRAIAVARLVEDGKPEHQVRVFEEKWDLDERLNRLLAFLLTPTFDSLPPDEQYRMREQSRIMGALSNVLAMRIAAF